MDDDRNLRYRLAAPEDLPDIATLFRQCNPDSVWAQFGNRVPEVYFRHYCSGNSGLTIVAISESGVVGACVGTTDPQHERMEFYKRYGPNIVQLMAVYLIANPVALLVLIRRTLRAATRLGARMAWRLCHALTLSKTPGTTMDPLKAASRKWSFVAILFVHPEMRGLGVGTMMLEEFQNEGARRGFDSCRINTTQDNVAAQRAIARAGFRYAGAARTGVTYVSEVSGT